MFPTFLFPVQFLASFVSICKLNLPTSFIFLLIPFNCDCNVGIIQGSNDNNAELLFALVLIMWSPNAVNSGLVSISFGSSVSLFVPPSVVNSGNPSLTKTVYQLAIFLSDFLLGLLDAI